VVVQAREQAHSVEDEQFGLVVGNRERALEDEALDGPAG
jgi:hypothetical protein